ncbi:hypothetical protein GGR57DRAFT_501433 [Xylariaceae sp. FL1272]|nr:hypothetical protein GGR57DRAFT_501433 [Xylariaceae sp. FL1272]
MRDELPNNRTDNDKSEGSGRPLRYVFGKAVKGVKWVIKEEWVMGRIDEIKDTLQVLTTINSHGAAKATATVQKLLQKINDSADVTTFFTEVGRIYRSLEKNPQNILARIEASPPSGVPDEPAANEWMRHQTGDDDVSNWLWLLGAAGIGKSCSDVAPHRACGHLAAVRDLAIFQGTHRGVQDAFRVLRAVAESFDRLYVTIDALDELPISNLATLLQRLSGLKLPAVKFFVTSRDASRVLPKARIVNANRNASTLHTFIQEKLKSIAGGRDSDLPWPVPLTSRLADDDDFSRQLLDCQKEEELQQSLNNLSRTLDGLIAHTIDRIKTQDAEGAARGKAALLWVIHTRGPLTGLAELQHALVFHFYGDNPATSPASRINPEFSRTKLTKFTSNVLSFESSGDSTDESISMHKALQDFRVGEGMGLQYFRDPHAVIARVCLWCLSVNKEPCRSREDWERLQPFLRYAASNWGWHMAASSQVIPDCPPPNMGFKEMLGDDPFLDIVTVAIQPRLKELGVWTKDMWGELRTKKPPVSALQILAFFDLDRVVVKWLEQSCPTTSEDKPVSQELLSAALHLAAIQGSHRTVLVLLRKGADPLLEHGKMGMTALQGACLHGRVDVVDALFRNTSDELCVEMVSHKNHHNRTALLDACSSIHIVQRILGIMSQMSKPAVRELLLQQYGRSGQGGNAMHSAAEADAGDVIDELLNFRPGGHLLFEEPCKQNGETPLHMAARAGSTNTVRRLLVHGANPNALDQNGNTPAMLATRKFASLTGGCFELLLAHTDLKVQNTIRRRNILHIACHLGRARHVKAMIPYIEQDRSVLSAREDGDLLPIMCASLQPQRTKFLCIEYLIPVMGRDLLPVEDARQLLSTSAISSDTGANINATGSGDRSTLEWCAELNNADIVETRWQYDPELLKPNSDIEKLLKLVSARNRVRKLWVKHDVVPGLNKPVKEIQCLHSLREGPGEVHAISGEADQTIYLESDPISETAKFPLSRLTISVLAQDQGWSSHVLDHPNDKGSIRGSRTWLEIAVKRNTFSPVLIGRSCPQLMSV